ncbi:hypothetical protein M407DRAFT_242966 [Tulasnella calospora MUT 4182]|uniref:Uncharacterized protein n=1 Tax=Tulasnella calospora MUT 4182 TaxID=1051891 RepID=A0A0C3L403_9AGAM|nr:hypothetical protein M407DRAFT_242966 [Tulasnella calospora MUT 4182]
MPFSALCRQEENALATLPSELTVRPGYAVSPERITVVWTLLRLRNPSYWISNLGGSGKHRRHLGKNKIPSESM